jgi:hypothetical protein
VLHSPYSVHIPALLGFRCDRLVAVNMSAYLRDGSLNQVVSHEQQLQSALAARRVEPRPNMAALAKVALHYMAQQTASNRHTAARLLKLWGKLNALSRDWLTSYLLEVIAVQAAANQSATVDMAATLHDALAHIASAPRMVRTTRMFVFAAASRLSADAGAAQVPDPVLPQNNLAASVVWGRAAACAAASLRKLERAAGGGVTVLDVLGPQQ